MCSHPSISGNKQKHHLKCRTCAIVILKMSVKWKNVTYWDLFPNLKRKNTVECYLDISVAEDSYPSVLIRQRMILANNFSFFHCKLSFKNEEMTFSFIRYGTIVVILLRCVGGSGLINFWADFCSISCIISSVGTSKGTDGIHMRLCSPGDQRVE